METLVTLEEAKNQLRIDTEGFDDDLTLKMLAASELVLMYLKTNGEEWKDSSNEYVSVPSYVKSAVLIWLGILWKERDGNEDGSNNTDYNPPMTVVRLLYMKRKPSLAKKPEILT